MSMCCIWYPGDEIRRVLVETVIPFAKELFISGVEKKRGRKGLIPDTILAEYDQFDDYLEMVIQFGVSTSCLGLFHQLPQVVVLCSTCVCVTCVCACVHVIFCTQTKPQSCVPTRIYLKLILTLSPQYITLFASAFPLGAVVTLLFLYVEVRSDFFKLLHAYRRPQPRM